MLDTFLLKLSWPNWLFFLTLLLLGGSAWYYYRRTLPPISVRRRVIATILRSLATIIVLFLVLQPVLELIYRHFEKPIVAVLLDESASMTINDPNGARSDSLHYLLENLPAPLISDSVDVSLLAFSDRVRNLGSDTLDFSSDATDLDFAIRRIQDSLSGRNLREIILVSDGIYTRGANPLNSAEQSRVPVSTVRIGEPQAPTDLAIRRVQHNAITYAGQETPVKITLWQNNLEGRQAVIKLRRGNTVVSRKQVRLGPSGFEQNVELSLKAGQEGDFRYQAEVDVLENELTAANNNKSFRLQVLKRQVNVLVLSGMPNFDRHFLSVTAEQLPDFRFTFLTQREANGFYESTLSTAGLDSVDVVILHGFPTAVTGNRIIELLKDIVSQRQLPVWWFINRHTRIDRLSTIAPSLPFQRLSTVNSAGDKLISLTVNGKLHPAVRVDENETANAVLWNDLPLLETFAPLAPAEGSQTLIKTNNDTNLEPVIFAWRKGQQKHLVFNGANFGNWYFQLQEDPARQSFFPVFVERALRWLKNRDDIQQIQIKPLQDTYNVGEALTFSGQVYDAFYRPAADARVEIIVWQDSTEYSRQEMQAEGAGFYRSDISGLPAGDYQYRITASRGEDRIGRRSGKISVQPFYQEFQTTTANHRLLEEISERSGGKNHSVRDFVENRNFSGLSRRISYTDEEVFLWDKWQWLLLLVILLGSEWFLRKRWGML